MVKKRIRGIDIWLNPKDHGISKRLIITKGMREPCFDWIIKKEASGIAFDVGANIGWVSLQLAKRCDRVCAFEPDPRNLKLLYKNANEKIEVIGCAVSDRNGFLNMSFNKKPNLNCISDKGEKMATMTLDNFSVVPNFIKMDIEGSETVVIKGAQSLLLNPLKILIEVHPDKYGKDNDFKKVLEDLVILDYRFKYVVNAKGKMDKFKNYKCVKKFKGFPRAVFKDISADKAIKWATEMPKDGKKVIRSILLVRE